MRVKLWNLSARENANLYVFIGVLFVVGAVFGVLLVHALTFEQQQELTERLGAYMKSARETGAEMNEADAFRESFSFYFKWLALIWLLGVSVIGLPFVLLLDFLKGILIGFTLGLLTQEWAWRGVLVFCTAVVPQNALVVPALIVASVSAARFAHFVVRERLFRRKGRLLPPFLAHTAAAAFMLAMLGLAALLEAYLSPILLEMSVPQAAAALRPVFDFAPRF